MGHRKPARFRGEFEHSLDEKGRTAIPAPLRDVFKARMGETPARLMLIRWLDPCLRLYVASDWETEEERFESRADDVLNLDETYADIRRVLFSLATEVSPDRHHRILIRPPLRAHAGVTDSIVWVGQGHYIELWDAGRWRARIETALQDRDLIGRSLRKMASREAV